MHDACHPPQVHRECIAGGRGVHQVNLTLHHRCRAGQIAVVHHRTVSDAVSVCLCANQPSDLNVCSGEPAMDSNVPEDNRRSELPDRYWHGRLITRFKDGHCRGQKEMSILQCLFQGRILTLSCPAIAVGEVGVTPLSAARLLELLTSGSRIGQKDERPSLYLPHARCLLLT
jgi:hypothetical protein